MQRHGDITVETEQAAIVDSLHIYIGHVMRIIETAPAEELSATHCLQYIDPWGDTIFNRLQKGRLALELKDLSNKSLEGSEAQNLARIIDFVNRYKDEVHLYIKFYGD